MKASTATALTWSATALVAASLAILYFSTRLPSQVSAYVVPPALLLPPFFVGIAAFFLNRTAGKWSSMLAAATPFTLVGGALFAFMTVDGNVPRVLIGLTAVGFTGLFLSYWHGMGSSDFRYRTDDFGHLSFAVHVVAMFFVMFSALGVSDFMPIPRPAIVAVVATLSLVTAAETLRRAGVRQPALMPVAFSVAALMTETAAALVQLPTSNFVNAMIGTVVYASYIHAVNAILVPESRKPAFFRHFAISFALVILVLSTARWA